MTSFGALLRRLRMAAGLTQEELAARSGLSVQAISMLERGVRRAPRDSTVDVLGRALVLEPAQRQALAAAARARGTEAHAAAWDAWPPPGGPGTDTGTWEAHQARARLGGARASPPPRPPDPARPSRPRGADLVAPLVTVAGVLGSALVVGLLMMPPSARATALEPVAGGALFVAVAALSASWLRARRPDRRRLAGEWLDRVADDLAEQVAMQWLRAAQERRLLNPAPIRVRWRLSELPVAGPLADAVGDATGLPRFPPLPGLSPLTAEGVSVGDLQDLLAVYGGLDSGRMLVLGAPGAGKSGAAIRLLLAALDHRRSLAASQRQSVPVPVLLSPRGWNPITQPLATWIAQRLSRDYPALRAAMQARDTALGLVNSGRLAVILDGLDEMPSDLRPVALRALDEQAALRLVVLSRSQELVAAAGESHLSGAAALELQPVDTAAASGYLDRCRPHPPPDAWRRLLADLRNGRAGVLARALDTPLALTLVRDAYGHGDPVDELLDLDRFGCPEAVTDHLLDRFLVVAYTPRPGQPRPRYTLAQARAWLGFLAHHMTRQRTTGDLAWWLVPAWRPAWPRNVVTALTVLISAGAAGALAGGRAAAVAVGVPVGLAAGLALLHETSLPQQVGRPSYRRVLSRANLVLGLAVGLVAALAFGIAVGLALGPAFGLVIGLLAGLLVGLASGLLFGLVDAFGHPAVSPASAIDPITCWRRDSGYLTALVAVFCAAGIVTGGLGWGLTGWMNYDLTGGLAAGVLGGLAVGLVLGFSGAFEGRLAPALVGRLASGFVRTIGFGLVIGLAAGLAGGLAYSLGTGMMFGFAFGLGFGLAFALPSSASWAAALTFAQLARDHRTPLRLLRFLEDARERQVLRVAGPVYQFRHGRLQERLARASEDWERPGDGERPV
jgi:transcriptional regulator with XRE-family HTH domain